MCKLCLSDLRRNKGLLNLGERKQQLNCSCLGAAYEEKKTLNVSREARNQGSYSYAVKLETSTDVHLSQRESYRK